MKNYKYLIAILFLLSLGMGAASGSVSTVRAQSEEDWTDPVNLSNSGSSVNPSVLVDWKGTIHAFWLDEFNGYQYVNSPDGVTWSAPQAVKVPFSLESEKPSKPLFLSGAGADLERIVRHRISAAPVENSRIL